MDFHGLELLTIETSYRVLPTSAPCAVPNTQVDVLDCHGRFRKLDLTLNSLHMALCFCVFILSPCIARDLRHKLSRNDRLLLLLILLLQLSILLTNICGSETQIK